MKSAVEAWKKNLDTKLQTLRDLGAHYLTARSGSVLNQIKAEIVGMGLMFGNDSLLPDRVREFRTALENHKLNDADPRYFLQLVRSYQSLASANFFTDDEGLPSFDEIFEAYKDDGELRGLVDEFTSTLQKIIAEGDDILTAHIARELEVVLAQVKKQQKSLYELQNWVDLGIRALIVTAETYSGTHGGTLAYEAVKLGYRIRQRVIDAYSEAQSKLINQRGLALVQKAVEQHPQLPSAEQTQKLLVGPKVDDRPLHEGQG